jgi:hypothetical protein
MTRFTTLSVLFLLIVSIAMVASCGQEVVRPADDPGASNTAAVLGDTDLPEDDDGTRTPGYWKNHPKAWPVGYLALGGAEYPKQRCIEMLGEPARGDHSVILRRALIAAKLNVADGCDGGCVAIEISAADVWFGQFMKATTPENVVPVSDRGRPLADVLDDYNNGLLCAPAKTD